MSNGASFFKDTNDYKTYAHRTLSEKIDSHEAKHIDQRSYNLVRVARAWKGFAESFICFLDSAESDFGTLAMSVSQWGDEVAKNQFISLLDQAALSYFTGMKAVVDQSRHVKELLSEANAQESERRTSALRMELPYADLLSNLRNYVQHYLALPWNFTGPISNEAEESARILIAKSDLLDTKSIKSEAKKYLIQIEGDLYLRPLIEPHLKATLDNVQWLLDKAWEDNEHKYADANNLISEKMSVLTEGATSDPAHYMEHIKRNLERANRGEPQQDFQGNLLPEV